MLRDREPLEVDPGPIGCAGAHHLHREETNIVGEFLVQARLLNFIEHLRKQFFRGKPDAMVNRVREPMLAVVVVLSHLDVEEAIGK